VSERRLLIAGIGNIFLGDDGFGVEVVRRLANRPLGAGVRVIDFGIRGFDLACALVDGYDGAILVDAVQRGELAGTLYVIEPARPAPDAAGIDLQPHGLHPEKVLRLAGALGEVCPWLRLVGCEPLTFGSEDNPVMGLSEPVQAAVEEGARLVERLARDYLDGKKMGYWFQPSY
jgi:hydrogenase maturation protease